MRKITLVILVLCFPSVALAADSAPGAAKIVQDAAAVVGALYVLLTAVATVLPKSWPLTHFLAKVSADLKGTLQPTVLAQVQAPADKKDPAPPVV